LVRADEFTGWGGVKNGDLVRMPEPDYDVFVTADQNLRYQQTLLRNSLRILELTTNDWRRIRAAGSHILTVIEALSPGEYRQLLIPPLAAGQEYF